MMTATDLVMMKNGSNKFYKKVLNIGQKHHYVQLGFESVEELSSSAMQWRVRVVE